MPRVIEKPIPKQNAKKIPIPPKTNTKPPSQIDLQLPPVYLRNRGDDCFMNSSLQALRHLAELRTQLNGLNAEILHEYPVLYQMRRIFADTNTDVEVFRRLFSAQFHTGQHSATEWIYDLIGTYFTVEMRRLFAVTMNIHLGCKACGNVSSKPKKNITMTNFRCDFKLKTVILLKYLFKTDNNHLRMQLNDSLK